MKWKINFGKEFIKELGDDDRMMLSPFQLILRDDDEIGVKNQKCARGQTVKF